ncbi:MAG: threonylcarbamoyl-AMP synthase [Crocinitomix sp. MedPE-SWsnd]|nr:MAG: threonylcarbamoyl-AMP synthase [Crocinitomix sp. MedPE-SWsnd]
MNSEIDQAVKTIKEGGVILYPTDTIWGLGCDPKNEEAIDKIISIKKRADKNGMLILVNSEHLLGRYVKEIPEVCYDLIDCADKPLTIVYPNGQYVSPKLLASDKSLAIRLAKNDFCNKLIQKLKSGIVSTSANISGEPNPNGFNEISDEIKNQVDYVVYLPELSNSSQSSQIIKISEKSEIQIIRK